MSSLQVQSLQIVERGVQERVQELYFKREKGVQEREIEREFWRQRQDIHKS